MSVAPDPCFWPERLEAGLTECDPDVLHRVVRVDFQIAARADRQINEAVPGHLVEHMIEKRQPGVDCARAPTVERDRYLDLGFGSVAGNRGCPGAHGRRRIDLDDEGAYSNKIPRQLIFAARGRTL